MRTNPAGYKVHLYHYELVTESDKTLF